MVYRVERPKDYYRVLGVERDASPEAIERAFRRLARQLKPRRTGPSAERFREVRDAYTVLADAEQRRRHDESLTRHERGLSESLRWSFVRSPAAGDLRRPIRPEPMSGELLLTTLEAAAGGVVPVDLSVETQCAACQGTGGFVFGCVTCAGEGAVRRRFPVPVHLPKGVRDGAVFQVAVDEPSVPAVWLTVHIVP